MKNLPVRRSLLTLLAGLLLAHIATAQTATDPNEGSRLTRDSILGSYPFHLVGPARPHLLHPAVG